jgi:hypothetical protein
LPIVDCGLHCGLSIADCMRIVDCGSSIADRRLWIVDWGIGEWGVAILRFVELARQSAIRQSTIANPQSSIRNPDDPQSVNPQSINPQSTIGNPQ